MTSPSPAVVARREGGAGVAGAGEQAGLQESLALMQSRLAGKLEEGKTVSQELEVVRQQRDRQTIHTDTHSHE